MSRLFAELTVSEMMRVLKSLPNPIEYQRENGGRIIHVHEPIKMVPINRDVYSNLNRAMVSVYSFKVIDNEWVMV